MQSTKRNIAYEDIEQDAMSSETSLDDFRRGLWIFLVHNKENCKSLGRELKVRRFSNPGNVYSAILDRLIGHLDTSFADIKDFLRSAPPNPPDIDPIVFTSLPKKSRYKKR